MSHFTFSSQSFLPFLIKLTLMPPSSGDSQFSITNARLSPKIQTFVYISLLDIFHLHPLRHLKYNLFKHKLIVTSLKRFVLFFIG